MHLIHNGSVGQGSPIEHQAEAQTEVTVEEVEEAEDVTIQRIVAGLDLSRPWVECSACFQVSIPSSF